MSGRLPAERRRDLRCVAAALAIACGACCRVVAPGPVAAPSPEPIPVGEKREHGALDRVRNAGAEGSESSDRPTGGKAKTFAEDAALDWLARNANTDGGWGAGASDPATTGWALLAMLGAGETHQTGSHKGTVKAGLRWLKEHQDGDGWFVPRGSAPLRTQMIATLAMIEAYGLTQSHLLHEPAQRATDAVLSTRLPAGGWGDGSGDGGRDAVLTVYGALVCASARLAELALADPPFADLGARILRGPSPRSPVDAAADAMTLVLCEGAAPTHPGPETFDALVAAFLDRGPAVDAPDVDDRPEYVWLATNAAYHAAGDARKRWVAVLVDVLVPTQVRTAGADDGSWPARGGESVAATTALRCIALESFYRGFGKGRARREMYRTNETR